MFLAVIADIYLLFYLMNMKAKINDILVNKTIYSIMKSISFEKYCKNLQYMDADRYMCLDKKKILKKKALKIIFFKISFTVVVFAFVLLCVSVVECVQSAMSDHTKSVISVLIKSVVSDSMETLMYYGCGRTEHIKKDCPDKTAIHELEVDDNEGSITDSDEVDSQEKENV